jgi:hypothetical protein
MRTRTMLLTLGLLAFGACGGNGFDRDVDVPDGYATYRGDGVSFVHPAGWEPTRRSLGHDVTEVRFQDPSARGAADPAISFTVQPGVGDRFDAQLDSELSVLESTGGAAVSREDVDFPGAEKAVRSSIESDRASSQVVDVLAPDGRHVALAAGGPEGELGPLDADAVVGSLRLEQR